MTSKCLMDQVELLAKYFTRGEIMAAQVLMADTMDQLQSFLNKSESIALIKILPSVEQAYSNRDFSFLSDILLYEIAPILNKGK